MMKCRYKKYFSGLIGDLVRRPDSHIATILMILRH